MSRPFSSALTLVFLVAIAFAANRASESPADLTRGPAALSKEQILGAGRMTSPLAHTEKLRGPLSVHLQLVGSKPTNPGDVFVLRGVISSRQELEGANFTWSIPEGLQVVNGMLNGTVASLSPTQSGVVEVTLKHLGTENLQVHLMASSIRGGARFADSAQYNTALQEALDANKEALKSALTSGHRKQLKVLH